MQFSKGSFTTQNVSTVGVDFLTKFVEIDGVQVKVNVSFILVVSIDQYLTTALQIWDTAGQERFRSLALGFVEKNAQGILMVYDCEDAKSFSDIPNWIKEIEKVCDFSERHLTLLTCL